MGVCDEPCPSVQEEVRLLADMFPDACRLELHHCLSLAAGCLEEAAQLLLARQESGDAITQQQQVGAAGGGLAWAERRLGWICEVSYLIGSHWFMVLTFS